MNLNNPNEDYETDSIDSIEKKEETKIEPQRKKKTISLKQLLEEEMHYLETGEVLRPTKGIKDKEEPIEAPKKKREMTERQKEALKKGQEKRKEQMTLKKQKEIELLEQYKAEEEQKRKEQLKRKAKRLVMIPKEEEEEAEEEEPIKYVAVTKKTLSTPKQTQKPQPTNMIDLLRQYGL